MRLASACVTVLMSTVCLVGCTASPPAGKPPAGAAGTSAPLGGAGGRPTTPGTGGAGGASAQDAAPAPAPDAVPAADVGGPPDDASGGPADAKAALDGAVASPDLGPPAPPPGEPPPSPPPAVCGMGGSRLGPPTAAELDLISRKIHDSPPTPAGTNQGNNFAYGNAAQLAGRMRTMYALTGDSYFLDQAIRFSDHMLAARNHPQTGRIIWTGKREPCWPNKAEGGGDAGYCGAENGLVVGNILGPAKIIFQNPALWDRPVGVPDPHGFGKTYLERARTYLREGRRTLDEFLIPHYVQPSKGNHLHIPTHPGFAALTPGNYAKDQGNSLPWNQQDMVVAALSTVSDSLLILKEDPATAARYDEISKAALDWFTADLQGPQGRYQINGVPVYKWGYAPGNFRNIENLAHASADINMLYNGYKRGRFGIQRSVLVPVANTFLEVIAKPDGSYASEVDGSGMRASVSASWMNYEEFRSGIVARLAPRLTVDGNTDVADAVTILSTRKRLCP